MRIQTCMHLYIFHKTYLQKINQQWCLFFFCAPPGTSSKYVCILATLAFTLKCPLMLPEIVEKIVTARVVARDEFNWWVEIHLDYLEGKRKEMYNYLSVRIWWEGSSQSRITDGCGRNWLNFQGLDISSIYLWTYRDFGGDALGNWTKVEMGRRRTILFKDSGRSWWLRD